MAYTRFFVCSCLFLCLFFGVKDWFVFCDFGIFSSYSVPQSVDISKVYRACFLMLFRGSFACLMSYYCCIEHALLLLYRACLTVAVKSIEPVLLLRYRACLTIAVWRLSYYCCIESVLLLLYRACLTIAV